jgi:hypothetical protein
MSEKRTILPFLMLILLIQMMVLSSSGRYGVSSESSIHSVMLEKFKPCIAKWKSVPLSSINEERYLCAGENTGNRGTVYEFPDGQWTAYAWGIEPKEFENQEAAKRYIETKMAYWLRPKAAWWKFWKEFDE